MSNDIVLQIQAYDWKVKDKYGDNDETTIDCWALDKNSNSYLLRILDFPIFCNIQLPVIINNRLFKWSIIDVDDLMDLINKMLGKRATINHKFVQHQTLYYYQGERLSGRRVRQESALPDERFHNQIADRECEPCEPATGRRQ